MVALAERALNDGLRQYLNRLSDLMFVLARVLNRVDGGDDVYWKSERMARGAAGRTTPTELGGDEQVALGDPVHRLPAGARCRRTSTSCDRGRRGCGRGNRRRCRGSPATKSCEVTSPKVEWRSLTWMCGVRPRVRHGPDGAETIAAAAPLRAAPKPWKPASIRVAAAARVAVTADGVALPDLDLGAVDGAGPAPSRTTPCRSRC